MSSSKEAKYPLVECFAAPEGSDKASLCIANMRVSEAAMKARYPKALQLFIASATAWLKCTGRNLQELEKTLRENQFSTHLIAIPFSSSSSKNVVLVNPNSKNWDAADPKLMYEAIYSVRPTKDALAELHQYWPSYEVNYCNLLLAGFRSSNNIQAMITEAKQESKTKRLDIFTPSELLRYSRLDVGLYGLRLHLFDTISLLVAFEEKRLEKAHKTTAVRQVLLGVHRDGGPIFGFLVNDQPNLSEIAYVVHATQEGPPRLELLYY